jgi:ATP/maltotriose-dependent transcriptional regulator MalT
LQLAALSMQGRDDVGDFSAGFAGDDRYIVDHLVEEVLQRQPERVRSFLLQTSILNRLTGSLCGAVTGRQDGRDVSDLLGCCPDPGDRSGRVITPTRCPGNMICCTQPS